MAQENTESSTSWGERLRSGVAGRATMSAMAAVTFAAVAPALANAAGADVPNPVAVALRGSKRAVTQLFTASEPGACGEVVATPSESVQPSTSGDGTDGSDGTESSAAPSVDPSAEAGTGGTDGTGEGTEASAEPSALPQPTEDCDDDSDEAGTTEATPSPSVSPTETEAEEAEDGNHGQIVRTVAHCAPRGKDPLFAELGDLRNHGAFVKVAAHGETLTTPWGSFDLSTQAGADALCARLAELRAALASASPDADESEKKGKGKGRDKAKKPKKTHAPATGE